MRVALIGNKGMLARDLIHLLQEADIPFWGADLPELDITREEDVAGSLELAKATVVINCAAYTAVDQAESRPGLAFAVNRDGVRNLAHACERLDIPLIHISTDYVFDGEFRRPYREDDAPGPLGVYGASKLAGENELRAIHGRHVIVRTSWLFGAQGDSFVKTILKLARERDVLRVVDDQYGCPTWTRDLADVLIQIAKATQLSGGESDPWGTYHYCGLGETSWCGFAKEIVDHAKRWVPLKAESVTPIMTSEFPTLAKRPQWSVLDCGKISRRMGVKQRIWKEGLSEVIRYLLVDPLR
jgi:dTDP-4-dehydrorhamnose reductase